MKIAWIGPMMNNGAGASAVSFQLLMELGQRGVQVDCYVSGKASSIPEELLAHDSLRFFCLSSSWEWNRWYSRNNFLAFVTGQLANLRTEARLAKMLLQNHLTERYDLLYQFSHIELSIPRRYRKQLPPIVMHPSVHAAGELRWHRREAGIARNTETLINRWGVRILLLCRVQTQRHHIHSAERILSLSEIFAGELMHDYAVNHDKFDIVPNPVDLEKFYPGHGLRQSNKLVILFVSRIAVRKGVEMIVELSNRLSDLADQIEIRVVGYKSLWSDYMGLLNRLNYKTATYVGGVDGFGNGMAEIYRSADLLIQSSHYEPFGLTVAEALASGIPVVSSDRVGASESVDNLCCRIFKHDDIENMERVVRSLIHELRDESKNKQIRLRARAEAERLFSRAVVCDKLEQSLSYFIQRPSSPQSPALYSSCTLSDPEVRRKI